ncbi:hypothetical protein D3C71_971720 [compost metagenome]
MKSQIIIYSLLICFITVSTAAEAQNLVPNPGFETAASCPSNNTFTAANWYSPNTGSPDYFNPCGAGWTIPGTGVLFGPQAARSGSSFAAVGWYGLGGGWYEYIQVELTAPLVAGETYAISLWVSLADGVMRAGDDLGIHISSNRFKSTTTIQPSITTVIPTTPTGFGVFSTLTPQIKCTDGNFITDAINWSELSGTYTATGGEQVITIGCFEAWATTGKLTTNATGNDRCYYYVDDVSVQQIVALPLELLSFAADLNSDHTVELKWETASEENVCYYQVERSKDGTNFQGLEQVGAAGKNNGLNRYSCMDKKPVRDLVYYRLKATDCNGRISYSDVLSVERKNTVVEIYPNPVLDELTVLFADEIRKDVCIYDAFGSLIFQSACHHEQLIIPFKEYPQGAYTLVIRKENEAPFYQKIVKNP